LKETKSGLGMVRAYYAVVKSAEAMLASFSPMMAGWAEKRAHALRAHAAIHN